MNPFKFGQIVSGDDFCARSSLVSGLKQNIRSGQNTYLVGERRMGKSSLVKEAIRTSRSVRAIEGDLLEIKSVAELCKELIRGIFASERNASFLERASGMLAGFRPSLTFDQVTNSWSVSIVPSQRFTVQSIHELMDAIAELGRKKTTVVVLDEFQDILKLKDSKTILATLRSRIQHQSGIAYIYAGSIRNDMEQIFAHPDSPFFKSALAMQVGPLDDKRFVQFLRDKFLLGKRSITDAALAAIFDMTRRNPGDVQQFCRALWDTTSHGQEVDSAQIPAALTVIFAQEAKAYHAMLNAVTDLQLKCLLGLARVGGKQVTSQEFIEASGVALPSSVKHAFTRLQKVRIVFRSEGEYKFFNPFFGAWLLHRKG